MNLCKIKYFFVLTFLTAFSMQAQNNELNLQIFGGASISTGDFGKKISAPIEITRRSGFDFGKTVGLASTGFNFGVELTVPVLYPGLGWQISSKFIMNPTDHSEIQTEFGKLPAVTGDLVFDTGNWYNIPVFTGVSYGIKLMDEVNIYVHLLGGINFTQQAYRKAVYDGVTVENTTFQIMNDFGFETGIDLEIFGKYVLNLSYLDLGSPRYEGMRVLNEKMFPEIPKREFHIDAEEKPVGMILLNIGMKLSL